MPKKTPPEVVKELRLPALEIRQGPERVLYSFAVDGKQLHRFAAVSRIRRSDSATIKGYQRPEVRNHIAEIRSYIESDGAMVPNALVIAFDERVRFESADVQPIGPAYSRLGTLVVPLDEQWTEDERPGWIVDGQQRAAAIRDAEVNKFPICVVGFITADAQEQREQFILVNSTKPLPKGLIYELLPNTKAKLPSALQRRRFPAYIADRLNYDSDSPFRGLIQTPTNPAGLVKDNSILRMIEQSLTEGALYGFRDQSGAGGQPEPILRVLKAYWSAVAEVFPTAWGLPPRRSRLMHGAGIVSMGLVMDAISDRFGQRVVPAQSDYAQDLNALSDVCRWTAGYWDFGPGAQRRWNELQNTSKDIQLLANYLLHQYKTRVWDTVRREA
jgi:DGQHR domain-containing protein